MKKVVFLVGDSGCGKTTLQNRLIEADGEKYTRIISSTTRPMRDGEVEGLDHHFTDDESFDKIEKSIKELRTACLDDDIEKFNAIMKEESDETYVFINCVISLSSTLGDSSSYGFNSSTFRSQCFYATTTLLCGRVVSP